MLPLDDPAWKQYSDATGSPYDAPTMLNRLLDAPTASELWDECWNVVVYQDAISEMSYAVVPYLQEYIRTCQTIDWNPVGLIATVELLRPDGPKMPVELAEAYVETIRTMPLTLLHHRDQQWDLMTTSCCAACVAFARGHAELGRVYLELPLDDALRCLETLEE